MPKHKYYTIKHKQQFQLTRLYITYVYVTRFDKSWLPHTEWHGWVFTTTRFLHQWTNNPCVYISLPMVPQSAFSGACFSGLSDMFKCLGDLQMAVVWLDKHPPNLNLPHNWPESLAIYRIGYYLWYLELKWVSGNTIWRSSTSTHEKTCTSWFLTTPNLHLYVITCDTGVKTAGNSASCPL